MWQYVGVDISPRCTLRICSQPGVLEVQKRLGRLVEVERVEFELSSNLTQSHRPFRTSIQDLYILITDHATGAPEGPGRCEFEPGENRRMEETKICCTQHSTRQLTCELQELRTGTGKAESFRIERGRVL